MTKVYGWGAYYIRKFYDRIAGRQPNTWIDSVSECMAEDLCLNIRAVSEIAKDHQ